jgi:hypothetical protein
MHNSLARSASGAVTCILAGAILVGCGSSGVPGGALGVSHSSLFRSADLSPAHRIGNEFLLSAQVTTVCHFNTFVSFSTSGNAFGPYPGTFNASGTWKLGLFRNKPGLTPFSEMFTIVSGSNTINGSFTWGGRTRVTGQCFGGGGGLNPGSGFKYTATLTSGAKMKTFSGPAREGGIYADQFREPLI